MLRIWRSSKTEVSLQSQSFQQKSLQQAKMTKKKHFLIQKLEILVLGKGKVDSEGSSLAQSRKLEVTTKISFILTKTVFHS